VTFRIAAGDRSEKIGNRLKLIHARYKCVRTRFELRGKGPLFFAYTYICIYISPPRYHPSPPPPPPVPLLLVSIGRLSNNSTSTARWMNFWDWNRLCPLCKLRFRKNIHREKGSADLNGNLHPAAQLNAAWIYRSLSLIRRYVEKFDHRPRFRYVINSASCFCVTWRNATLHLFTSFKYSYLNTNKICDSKRDRRADNLCADNQWNLNGICLVIAGIVSLTQLITQIWWRRYGFAVNNNIINNIINNKRICLYSFYGTVNESRHY